MDMDIVLHDNDRVEAVIDGRVIATDQDGSAPQPFELFLASLGTCSGFYVARFCRKRGIPTEGVRIRQRSERDPETKMVRRIDIEIDLPPDFPESYREAVVRSANLCAVKKHLHEPPQVEVSASIRQPL